AGVGGGGHQDVLDLLGVEVGVLVGDPGRRGGHHRGREGGAAGRAGPAVLGLDVDVHAGGRKIGVGVGRGEVGDAVVERIVGVHAVGGADHELVLVGEHAVVEVVVD